MPLRYNYKTPMGKMVIEQKNCANEEKKRFTILICEANCMAAFIHISKNAEGKEQHTLYMFFADKAHANRCAKAYGSLFADKVISIELNMAFRESKQLLDVLVKNGYKVKCYYKKTE